MPDQEKFHWAGKVSRRDIQRLYESEAQGLLMEVAARLGIRGRSKMSESELISEILRLAPELGE